MRLSRYSGRISVTPSSAWPGLEAVFQRARDAVHASVSGNRCGLGAEAFAEDVFPLQEQDFRIAGFGFRTPLLERRAVVQLGRDARIERAEHALLVQPHAGLARLVFQVLDFLHQARLCANHASRVSYSPLTRAPRMNSSRDSAGSMGP